MLALQTRQLIDPAEIRQAFRLRYRIYCEKLNWLDRSEHPDGLETDVYDDNSAHFGAFDGSRLVGYIRMIVADRLPIHEIVSIPRTIQADHVCAEASRLIVDKACLSNRKDAIAIIHDLMKEINLYSKTQTHFSHWIGTYDTAVFRVLRMNGYPLHSLAAPVHVMGSLSIPAVLGIWEFDEYVKEHNSRLHGYLNGQTMAGRHDSSFEVS